MSTSKNTRSFTFRFSCFNDMDIISRLAMEENKNDYVRDALWYYMNHEDEAREEVEEHRKTIRKQYHAPRKPKEEKKTKRVRKKILNYAFPTISSNKLSTSDLDQTTRTS